MNIINDMILVNKNTFKNSIESFRKNWIIVFTGLIYVSLNLIMVILISTLFSGVLSILAGLAIAIISSSLISNYLYLLHNIINYDRLSWQIFKDGFKHFLWKVYGIFFLAWIGNFLLSSFGNILGISWQLLYSIVKIVIIIGLNPLPETIYQKYYSPGESIRYAFDFMKDNWLNWLLPNILFYLILYLLTRTLVTNMFTIHLGFSPRMNIADVLIYLLGQGLFSFIMIYRGHLFKLLSTSTPRKRMYMNSFYS